uniref:Butyrophilin subfamily 3 member A2-like n=1 Tax=Sparus aurata TaxID=8175 RepID=A0A671TLL3_SPAAU
MTEFKIDLLFPGQSQEVGPPQPVMAMVGDDIVLPCQLETPVDAVSMTMEWGRPDLDPRFVYVWHDGQELLVEQNKAYKGRASLSINKLKHGDLSLTLSKVNISDNGIYRCYIPKLSEEHLVELLVGVVSSIVISLERTGKDEVSHGLALKCNSTGWYPEPEVFWLDGEGNLLSAGPTETVRGPDDLYTVSSRVTVEKRHSNSFTCRVQQNHINQTREALIHVPEDVFMEPSCSNVGIHIVLSAVCVLLLSALVFAVWKLRRNKSQNKKHHNKGPEEGTQETELLISGQKNMEGLDDGKLKEKVEEKTYMTYVISVLSEKKNKVEDHRDKLMSQIETVETERRENEKKLQSFFPIIKSSLSDMKLQLDHKKTEYEKSSQRITGGIQTTEDIITTITERMKKVEKQAREMSEQPEDTNRPSDEIQSDQSESKEETDRNTDVLTTAETQPNLHVSDSPAGGSSSHGESGIAEQFEIITGEMMDEPEENK